MVHKYSRINFSAFSAAYGLKSNIWLARYTAEAKPRIFGVSSPPKKIQKDPGELEDFPDTQSGEDSTFRIRSRYLKKIAPMNLGMKFVSPLLRLQVTLSEIFHHTISIFTLHRIARSSLGFEGWHR